MERVTDTVSTSFSFYVHNHQILLTELNLETISFHNLLRFMKKNQKNEELQSRREFFKKAAKSALPILGAISLSFYPIFSDAIETSREMGCGMGCRNECIATCKGSCSMKCVNSCAAGCDNYCSRTCRNTSR